MVVGVELERAGVGVERLAEAAQLQEGLAQAVPGVHIRGRSLDDGPVQRRGFLPLALERELDGLFGALSLETDNLFTFGWRIHQSTSTKDKEGMAGPSCRS